MIRYPLLTEKAVGLIERENKLVFVVDKDMKKDEIKKEVEETFKVKIVNVNTQINRKGIKRAYVTLAKENNASDIATKLGII